MMPWLEWDDRLTCRNPEVARSFVALPSANAGHREAAKALPANPLG